MTFGRAGMLVAASALLAACATSTPYESSSGGIALRVEDDVDALENAVAQAERHCEDHDRHAVLRAVSPIEGDRVLATFTCADSRGAGVALIVDDDDDLDDVRDQAERYCADYNRIAVLQSVSGIGDRGVATFECVREA